MLPAVTLFPLPGSEVICSSGIWISQPSTVVICVLACMRRWVYGLRVCVRIREQRSERQEGKMGKGDEHVHMYVVDRRNELFRSMNIGY